MKVELHLLQSFPPNNLNRDDTGAPKDAEFGGHRRARLSSQSLKRAIRTSETFRDLVAGRVGLRTRRAAGYVRDRLMEDHDVDEHVARALANSAVEALLSGLDEKDQTSVLYYAARAELGDFARRLAEAAPEHAEAAQALHEAEEAAQTSGEDDEEKKPTKEQKKDVNDARSRLVKELKKSVVKDFIKAQKGKTSAADIALFGRMLAEEPQLGLDASCQVAHALSVDRVAPAFDYFTAVDDLKDTSDADDAGAGMIGTTGFNAACYYRYAVVDIDQLKKNLDGDEEATADTVRAFLTAAVTALPTGKQNTFAAQIRPELVMTVVRRDGMPLSLVNAFANPVRTNGRSLAEHAAEKLNAHWIEMEAMYAGLLPGGREPDVFVVTPYQEALTYQSKNGALDAELSAFALLDRLRPTVRAVIDETLDAINAQSEGRQEAEA